MEKYSYEALLKRALSRVPNELDKRESSPIYSALAPACFELSKAYEEMKKMLSQVFAQSADREFLLLRAKERGIDAFPATFNTKKAEFKDINEELVDVDLNLRFSIDDYTFLTTKRLSTGIFLITCEQAGEAPNASLGDLLPVDNIEGLGSARILENVVLGEEEESTEHLRERYLSKAREPATSGNTYHYRRWALEVKGVGAAKIFPLHQGPGTVKVVIVNSKMQPADKQLLEAAKTHIEESRPIGANVEVVTATSKEISVSANVKTEKSASLSKIQSEFSNALKEYFKKVSFQVDYISVAKVGNLLLNTEGVADFENLQLNKSASNIPLENTEIPVLSSISLGVMQ